MKNLKFLSLKLVTILVIAIAAPTVVACTNDSDLIVKETQNNDVSKINKDEVEDPDDRGN